MIALVDGDLVAYRCAASCEPTQKKPFLEPLDQAIYRCDEIMHRIMLESGSDSHKTFLSGPGNFRYEVDPDYKANRRRLIAPTYLLNCRDFLLSDWDARIVTGYEADDAIGIAASPETVVCSNDKDFRQIAGHHYDFTKSIYFEIDEVQAQRQFWYQMLIGDKADNVRGVLGFQAYKTAERTLESTPPEDWEHLIRQMYDNDEWFYRNQTLLRILRSEEEYAIIRKALDENEQRKTKGTVVTATGSEEDLSPFQTINS